MLKKILSFYTQYFAVWVVGFGVLAYFFPGPFNAVGSFQLTEHLSGNKLFFALTMFGIGAVLQAADFQRIVQKPTIVLIGCCAQFTIMPLGAFVVAKVLDLPDAIAVGLILTGSAPGAMASNVMSYIAKADTAYSVSLTTVSTILCPILTPGLTLLLAGRMMNVNFVTMMISIMEMVVIPVLLGFTVRHFYDRQIKRIEYVFPAISATFIIFICSVVIAANHQSLAVVSGAVLTAVLILNIYGTAGGYGVGTLFRMVKKRRRTLAIEIGMQNAGLGVILAKEHFKDEPTTTLPAAYFVFVCIITASAMAAWWQRKDDSPMQENSH